MEKVAPSARIQTIRNQVYHTSIWVILQFLLWVVGVLLVVSLFAWENIGLKFMWNVLIPVAPLLLVVATGLWRNICPLASSALFLRKMGINQGKKMTVHTNAWLQLSSVILLYVIVPLRHPIFNNNGWATGLLLLGTGLASVIISYFFEWKSAWCSGLCPVSTVEKLYGQNAALSLHNAHCTQCYNCVTPCPDAVSNKYNKFTISNKMQKFTNILLIGGLPGFIWGWFQVADSKLENQVFQLMVNAYLLPFAGLLVSMFVYWLLLQRVNKHLTGKINGLFAATAVSCYYSYRIPQLFGFGYHKADGLLIDISNLFPYWMLQIFVVCLIVFFYYWLVFRKNIHKSWIKRPPYASK